VGGVIAGWFAAKGWLSADQVMSFLNSGTFIGLATSVVTLILGWLARTKPNLIKVVNSLPEVAAVITTKDQKGVALANSIPSNTVVAAGTPEAANIVQ
jgi:uncharacterized membrane protein (DUF441 family)